MPGPGQLDSYHVNHSVHGHARRLRTGARGSQSGPVCRDCTHSCTPYALPPPLHCVVRQGGGSGRGGGRSGGPRGGGGGGGSSSARRYGGGGGGRPQKYDKNKFLQANFRFLVSGG